MCFDCSSSNTGLAVRTVVAAAVDANADGSELRDGAEWAATDAAVIDVEDGRGDWYDD